MDTNDSKRRNRDGDEDACDLMTEAQERKRSRRRVVKTNHFDFDGLDNEEQRMVQQAIRNSQRDQKRAARDSCIIPLAPVFHPSPEEFTNPIQYISKIKDLAAPYGICKIVPPPQWKPKPALTMDHPLDFPTRVQEINKLQEGQGFEDGKRYNIKQYKEMADQFKDNWCATYFDGKEMTREEICKEYWDAVETGVRSAVVEYGNDLDTSVFGSGFPSRNPTLSFLANIGEEREDKSVAESKIPESENSQHTDGFDADFYATSGWNLTNLPTASGSLLLHITESINGVNVPWLYVGMMFASFCWHTEDNYLYSINYSHFGDAKQWYGVSSKYAKAFEKVSKDFLLASFRESPDLLQYMTTQLSPYLLSANGVPVYQAVHEPGTFIVTFPQAYHAGFSYGFNVGEAVNFAVSDWLPFGADAVENYRLIARPPIFSHDRLLFTLFNNLNSISLCETALKSLASSVLKVVDEDIALRRIVVEAGVRDLSGVTLLPANNFARMDKQALEYDDLRACCACKHICLLTAVACECSRSKVSCLRHYEFLCKCPHNKKFLLCWATHNALADTQKRIIGFQTRNK